MHYFQGEHVSFCINPGLLELCADVRVYVCVCVCVREREREREREGESEMES